MRPSRACAEIGVSARQAPSWRGLPRTVANPKFPGKRPSSRWGSRPEPKLRQTTDKPEHERQTDMLVSIILRACAGRSPTRTRCDPSRMVRHHMSQMLANVFFEESEVPRFMSKGPRGNLFSGISWDYDAPPGKAEQGGTRGLKDRSACKAREPRHQRLCSARVPQKPRAL